MGGWVARMRDMPLWLTSDGFHVSRAEDRVGGWASDIRIEPEHAHCGGGLWHCVRRVDRVDLRP